MLSPVKQGHLAADDHYPAGARCLSHSSPRPFVASTAIVDLSRAPAIAQMGVVAARAGHADGDLIIVDLRDGFTALMLGTPPVSTMWGCRIRGPGSPG